MKKKKILAVDDAPIFLELIKAQLQANNYEVITAADGQEALEKIKREKPDAVLLDVLLPKMDGIEALRRIRKFDKNLPVFMVTGSSREKEFKQARELKASGFIVKDSNLKEEIQKISSVLRIADRYRSGEDKR